MPNISHKIGWKSATSLVISSMVGTGVFTSLGFQLVDVPNFYGIILLWVLGAFLALIGAFTYAELGTLYKESGGEVVFVKDTMGALPGFLVGWVSFLLGFAAPVAIAMAAFEVYLRPLDLPFLKGMICALLILITYVHSFSIKNSKIFHNASTAFKLLFILGLILTSAFCTTSPNAVLFQTKNTFSSIFNPGFAVSLLYVSYAYTGWNTSVYIVEEIKEPNKNLPKSLIIGVFTVAVLYILLNVSMMKHGTLTELRGTEDVASRAFGIALGKDWGQLISLLIGFQLLATMSSYIWVGPRVTSKLVEGFANLTYLQKKNNAGIPVSNLWLQCVVSLFLFLSGGLSQILLYTSFILQISSTLGVSSLLLSKKKNSSFKSPFKPYLQWLYIVLSSIACVFIAFQKPIESLMGCFTLLIGVLFFYILKPKS